MKDWIIEESRWNGEWRRYATLKKPQDAHDEEWLDVGELIELESALKILSYYAQISKSKSWDRWSMRAVNSKTGEIIPMEVFS